MTPHHQPPAIVQPCPPGFTMATNHHCLKSLEECTTTCVWTGASVKEVATSVPAEWATPRTEAMRFTYRQLDGELVSVSLGFSGRALRISAPPCGTEEAKGWSSCVAWVVEPMPGGPGRSRTDPIDGMPLIVPFCTDENRGPDSLCGPKVKP